MEKYNLIRNNLRNRVKGIILDFVRIEYLEFEFSVNWICFNFYLYKGLGLVLEELL